MKTPVIAVVDYGVGNLKSVTNALGYLGLGSVITGDAEELEEKMFGAFMAFVRTGVPAQKDLPRWDGVTETAEPTMIFDRECAVRERYDDKLYALIDGILPPFNLMEMLASQNVQH